MVIIYLITVNATAFILMLADKFKAKKNLWRIPEVVLFGAALLGGSVGVLCGMYLVWHKTRQLRFTVGIPVILALQIVLSVLLLN